jgi:cytochrome c1
MDTATLIVLVLLVLGIGAILLGSTIGVPGAIREPPQPKRKPALAVAEAVRSGQVQQDAFARKAARADSARGLTPAAGPDDSVGMQLKVMAGVVTAALIILAVGAYVILEPTRETFAADRQLNQNVRSGATLFTANCARCHGPTGTGHIGPNLHLNEFAARYKWNPNDPADMARMRALVVNTITRGRPGTLMPTWSQDDGGPLNETQISNLADLIMTNGWQYVVPAPAAAGAAPTGAETAGQAAMTKYGCGACHTIQGVPNATGTVGPNLNLVATVPKIPESTGNLENTPANLQKWILNAPQVKPDVVMPDFQGQGMSEAEAQAIVEYLEALKSSPPAPAAAAAPRTGATGAAVGQALLTKYGCVACHTIEGVPGAVGTIGPNLTHVATVPKIPQSTGNLDNNPANLKKWILNAPGVKPGIVMPNFQAQGMTDAEAQAIVDYFEGQQSGTPAAATGVAPTATPAAGAAPTAAPTAGAAPTPAPAAGAPAANPAAAQALLTKYGCGACHAIQGVPGAVGTIGPNLTHVASVPKIPESTGNLDNNPDNLKKWILNAPGVKPGIAMPNFQAQGMTDAEAQTLVDYLDTLK